MATVIAALAEGPRTRRQLARAVGRSGRKLGAPLRRLVDLGLAARAKYGLYGHVDRRS